MIVLLTGDNDFAVQNEVRKKVAEYIAVNGSDGVEKVDAEDLDVARLPELLQGVSLFCANKLVVISNVGVNKIVADKLAELLGAVGEGIDLILVERQVDKRTKLYKWLKSRDMIQEFSLLNASAMGNWVVSEVKKMGGKISASDAVLLVRRSGVDQWKLHNEIMKLMAFSSEVSAENIYMLVEPSPEGSVFDLLESALSGDKKRVGGLLKQLEMQEDPYKLFGLLASQIHTLALVYYAGSKSSDVVAREAGIHPFVARKTQSVVRRLNAQIVNGAVCVVADCDIQMKSSGASPWYLLDLALSKIANLCSH